MGLSVMGALGCDGLFGSGAQRVYLASLDSGFAAPSVSDSGVADAGVLFLTGGGRIVAMPLGPQPLPVSGEVLLFDGGSLAFRLAPEEAYLDIGKADTLVLYFPARLVDYRVRLFDRAEMVVPSDDHEALLADGGLEYRIALQAPLKPSRTYSLTIDAQVHAAISDDRGRLFKDRMVDLRIVGAAEPEAPTKTKKRGSKRKAKPAPP
jgi:hypothetical protein